MEDTDKRDNFPSKEALELGGSYGAEVVTFLSGEICLRQMAISSLRLILGIADTGEVEFTGLRFSDNLGDLTIESNPSFCGKDPLMLGPEESNVVSGVVKIGLGSTDHSLSILLQKYDLGQNGCEYSLTLIPCHTLEADIFKDYLCLVARHGKKQSGV